MSFHVDFLVLLTGELARQYYAYLNRATAAVNIQKNLRRLVSRKDYLKVKAAAIILQRCSRRMAAQREFRNRLHTRAAVNIQVTPHLFCNV